VTGKILWELYPELKGTEAERQFRKVMEERVPVEFEFFFEPWSAYFAHRVYPSPDNGIALYSREISEAKKAEDALRKAEKLAVAGRMAASIAHEINNPLEAVTNLVYIARNDATISPQARAFLEAAERELARLSQIANKTLRFYRQSSSATRVKIADVLDSVVLLFDTQLKQKNIKVISHVDQDASLLCLVGEIQQVFTNLVSNAIDSMQRDGKLLLSVRKGKAWSKNSTEGVRVSIADTGTGIQPEIKKRLFEPFVTTKGEGGTGLGLWVSREILDRHKAQIRVRSLVGHGTAFSLFFPENGINQVDEDKTL
jgi:signal transduction histidine kinase